MFGLEKILTPKKPVSTGTLPTANTDNVFDPETAVIHTMQDDLDALKGKPQSIEKKVPVKPVPQAPQIKTDSHGPFSEPAAAPRNPLYGTINTRPSAPERQEKTALPENHPEPENTTVLPLAPKYHAVPLPSVGTENFKSDQSTSNPDQSAFLSGKFKATPSTFKDNDFFHLNWRLLFLSAFAIFLFLIVAWLGFNYSKDKNYNPLNSFSWKTFSPNKQSLSTTPSDVPSGMSADDEPVSQQPALSFSQENPNYLRIEDQTPTAESIQASIKDYANKVYQENYSGPVEFIVTDSQNKPLGFRSFANLMGIRLSPTAMALLGEDFSLFVFDDFSAPKIALAIDSHDDINLTKVMLQEEKDLADEISPIFFTTNYKKDRDFYSTTYQNVNVRYENIISPENLSVDYAVHGNKLLIGTTKLTMFAIIDHELDATSQTGETSN